MNATHKHRWLRFSLLALIVIMATLGVGLGYTMSIVVHRRSLLKWVIDKGGMYETAEGYSPTGWRESSPLGIPGTGPGTGWIPDKAGMLVKNPKLKSFPAFRKGLGDEAIFVIRVPNASPAERKQLRAAFPEAITN